MSDYGRGYQLGYQVARLAAAREITAAADQPGSVAADSYWTAMNIVDQAREQLTETVREVRAIHFPEACARGCLHCAHCGLKYGWPCPVITVVDRDCREVA